MMMQGEGALRPPVHAAGPRGSLADGAVWAFQWVDGGAPAQGAHVTGQLRWRGFDLGFAVDGLLGVDGRLAAPSLATLPVDLQPLVLHHVANECLRPFASGPLADMTLVSLQWHADPLPMAGEFEFTVRRAGLPGVTRGRMAVFNDDGRRQLLDALASLRWPLPSGLARVQGRLHIGTVSLAPAELNGLEEGDLVWVDDAELSPSGLRAQFVPVNTDDASCFAWIKRSAMARHGQPVVCRLGDAPADRNALASKAQAAGTLWVASPRMAVQRAWLQGAMPAQLLDKPALAMTWTLEGRGGALCEGQLLVVARRLGLRVTHMLQKSPSLQEEQVN